MDPFAWARCAWLVLGVATLAACGASGGARSQQVAAGVEPDAIVTVDGARSAPVTLAVGRTLAVELRSLGDSGYGNWVLTGAPDPAVLELKQATHAPPDPHPPGFVGDFGKDLFVLRASGVGETRLVLTATRPWSGETASFTLAVVVQ